MNIFIILFIILGIINIFYKKIVKMNITKSICLITLYIILLCSFELDNLIVRFISKLFIGFSVYELSNIALDNNEYTLLFLLILSTVAIINIVLSLIILNKNYQLYNFKKIDDRKTVFNKKTIILFNENIYELNKIYIDLCKMLN